MPSLTWASKTTPTPLPASLELESVFYPQGVGYPDASPNNHLILGDNLAAMSTLLPEYEGRINLIYTDPPFFTNRRYQARIGQGEDSRKPQDWKLAEGYADHWTDIESYLDMLYPRLALMHRLLAPTGTLYLHLDWHADAYARLLLDEIFGPERLLNQIIWTYHGPSPIRSAFNRKHDTILVYTKSDQYTFNVDAVRQPYDPVTVKTFASSSKAGFGKVPNLERGKVPEDWWYFPVIARLHNERTGYPTQKPAALLERIILASSNSGDLVADFFCGSGTTPVVASRLGRRFIASDITFRAVHTTRSRLVTLPAPPFALHLVTHPGSTPLPVQSQPTGFSLQLSDRTLSLSTDQVDEIDYWEVDPAYDGKIFRSAAQAVRPRKKIQISTTLTLPGAPAQALLRVCLVDIHGKVTYETLRPWTHLPLR
jgi:site-specific DNA-methyltransferase (adenine-specific)